MPPPSATLLSALAIGLERGPEYVRLVDDGRQTTGRDPVQRRAYVGRPGDYCREILGVKLTAAQEEILRTIFDPCGKRRYLIRAGNNLGKTFVLACAVLYVFDVLASLLRPGKITAEQGAGVILTGPTQKLVADTMYRQLLEIRAGAQARGFNFPGTWSDVQGENGEAKGFKPEVNAAAKWYITTVIPAQRVGQPVATAFSGRHAEIIYVFICEASGVPASTWASADGIASGSKNVVVADFNPTSATTEAFRRAQLSTWDVSELSALDHPNVRQRRDAVPGGAISHQIIEGRILTECQCRGPYPGTEVDSEQCDFVYALPPAGMPEREGPRKDGYPGHPDAPLMVWRPSGLFVPQVLGKFPLESQDGLFDMQAWNRSVARWKQRQAPARSPDRLGFDVAREGKDSSVGAPAWGRPAAELMRAWRDAEVEPLLEDEDAPREPTPDIDLMRALLAGRAEEPEEETPEDRHRALVVSRRAMLEQPGHRLYIGGLVVAKKGKAPEVIEDVYVQLSRAGVDAPAGWVVDEGGVGAGAVDVLSLRGVTRRPVSFGGSPSAAEPGEQLSENMRTQMAMRLAWLVAHDLIDLPDDAMLMEEARVARISYGDRPVTELGQRETVGRSKTRAVARLMSRQDFIDALGRSPDRLTAVALAAMSLQEVRIR
jgi:hypothetical protein